MDVFEVLVTELDSKAKQLKEWMASGNAQSFDSYQKICGEIQGLLFAKPVSYTHLTLPTNREV